MKIFLLAITLSCLLSYSQNSALANEIRYCGERVPQEIKSPLMASWWDTEVFAKPVLERLVDYDSQTKNIGPMLAEKWFVNDNQSEFTIVIRKGIKFHSGTNIGTKELDADDVLSTFKSLLGRGGSGNPNVRNRLKEQGLNALSQLSELEKIDAYTIRFRFDSPQPSFLSELSNPLVSIHSSQYLDLISQGVGGVLPVGTGQWKISNFEPHVGVTYEAFSEHWRGKPPFDRMTMRALPDPFARAAGLASGECDVIYIQPSQTNLLDSVAADVSIYPNQFIAAKNSLICYEADSALGNLASVCLPSSAASSGKDQCPKCPKSGACPQSILAARKQCCPKSGSCGQ